MRLVTMEPIESETLPEELPGWERVSVDGVVRIERTYQFRDQAQAVGFTHLLGELADAANHHPSLLVQRKSVTVAWWTFSLGALTKMDFVMAERTDRLYEAMEMRLEA